MKHKILEIFKETPVNILEDSDSYIEVFKWELSFPREDSSRLIGSFNWIRAAKLIADSTNTTVEDNSVVDTLTNICDTLVSEGELRETPEYRRSKLQLVKDS